MKKAKKVFIMLFLAIVMVFGIVGCSAGTQNDLQAKIDDLQSQIAEMEDRLAEMDEQLRDRDEKIEQLEKELAEKCTGTFYTLQEAYDCGWLTQADLMSIAYYHNGGRTHNEEIMSDDYAPLPKTPEVLSDETILKIKNTAARNYSEHIRYAEADGFTIAQYCGTYGSCVAIMMIDIYSETAAVEWIDTIAGVNFYYNDGNSIKIWREKEGLTLNEQLENTIKQDYLEQFGYEFRYDCFYGFYSNCAIFFIAGDAAITKSITIAGQTFQYNYDWEIYVWRSGKFATLAEAYSTNWLTSGDIESIAFNHNQFVNNV